MLYRVMCVALAALSLGAAPAADYVVVVSQKTAADRAWSAVVDALARRHKAAVVRWDKSVAEAAGDLSRRMPRYACFVATPAEAGRPFVVDVNRLTRKLDDDPYGDVQWGIVTGYTAADALTLARDAGPLVVRRAGAGTGIPLELFEEGAWFSEGEAGVSCRKEPGGKPERHANGPADSTAALAELFNGNHIDLFLTSGHATERDWQAGYSYKNGQFRCKDGVLYGIDLKGKAIPIRSPNPKVYLAAGNCLIGHIADDQSMALAFLGSGGVRQMVGYTVVTWRGVGGWGTRDYFFGQAGRTSLSDAFFFNNQTIVQRLETAYPGSAKVEFDRWNLEKDPRLLGLYAVRLGYTKQSDQMMEHIGLLWDRDTVAFYGDPAYVAKLTERDLGWTQTITEKDGACILEVNATADVKFGKPVAAWLPTRMKDARVTEGADQKPLLTDRFVMLPELKELKAGQSVRIGIARGKDEQ